MVYTGFLDFGGREVINAARTVAYARNLIPMLDLRDCSECDDLATALGHEAYNSPLVDQPAWFDPDVPETWGFIGLYPLSFEGFEDSTFTATVTELVGDGAVVGGTRRASRSLRITGLLIGVDDAAVSAGMAWLRSVLRPGSCGSTAPVNACVGDHVTYFIACPPVCGDSPDLVDPTLPLECGTGVSVAPISACTLPFERHLYNTYLLEGPAITEVYDLTCGSMVQVEFTLVAGTPSPFGTASRVTQVAPNIAGLPTVADVECPIGEPLNFYERVNLALNPGVQLDAGWESLVAGGTRARTTTNAHTAGNWTVTWTRTSVGSTALLGGFRRIGAAGSTTGTLPAVNAGRMVQVAVWCRPTAAARKFELYATGVQADGTSVGRALIGTIASVPSNTWRRITGTYVPPPGSVRLDVEVRCLTTNGALAPNGSAFAISDVLIEQSTVLAGYFDGNIPDTPNTTFAWTGTVGSSTSTSNTLVTVALIDPDCPPPPAAPRPPVIDESCIDPLTSYKRFTVTIPRETVPTWTELVPILNVRALGEDLRQLRVRFYNNPQGVPVESLEPCAFDGEFIVSYLPVNSTMSIDGIGQTITVAGDDGGVQQAAHLLYGSGGGPVVWPALTCGDQYDVVVDVDPTATGLEFELCVAPRE